MSHNTEWKLAKEAKPSVPLSISRLELSLLYLPHIFYSFYTLPHQKYRMSSFPTERPPQSISIFRNQNIFTGNHATKLKWENWERTSANTDFRSRTFGPRIDVGFIGPIKFLSDLTVGPTYFAKSAKGQKKTLHEICVQGFLRFSDSNKPSQSVSLTYELA